MIAPVGRKYHTKEDARRDQGGLPRASSTTRREAEIADVVPTHPRRTTRTIVIPRVHHSLSTRRVLTPELHRRRSTTRRSAPKPRRRSSNARAQTIWRFMFRSLFKHGDALRRSAPGQLPLPRRRPRRVPRFRLREEMPPDLVRGMKRYIVAAMDERLGRVRARLRRGARLRPDRHRGVPALHRLHEARARSRCRRRRSSRTRTRSRARRSRSSFAAAKKIISRTRRSSRTSRSRSTCRRITRS